MVLPKNKFKLGPILIVIAFCGVLYTQSYCIPIFTSRCTVRGNYIIQCTYTGIANSTTVCAESGYTKETLKEKLANVILESEHKVVLPSLTKNIVYTNVAKSYIL